MESVAKRLDDIEANVDSMRKDLAFVTTLMHATQIALRSYQEEKHRSFLPIPPIPA